VARLRHLVAVDAALAPGRPAKAGASTVAWACEGRQIAQIARLMPVAGIGGYFTPMQ
jgi:hypothetical protein